MGNKYIYSLYKNPCNIYLSVCLLYSLQSTGFYELGQISVLLHAVLVCMSVYYFIYTNRFYRLPPFLKALDAIIIIVSVYTIFRFAAGDRIVDDAGVVMEPTGTIRSMYPLLSIFSFYAFSQKGYLNQDLLKRWVFVFIGCAILSIYGVLGLYKNMLEVTGFGAFTNNAGYAMLSIMPAVVFFKKKPIIQYSMLLVMDFFVFSSMKRGAMLIGVLCTLYFLYQSYKHNTKHRTAIFLVSVIAVVSISYYFILEYSTNEYFINRVEMTREGNSSNRDIIYDKLFSIYINQSSIFEQVFGHGLDGCAKHIGIIAHSDWIEFLFDIGVLGIGLLISFFFSLHCTANRIRKVNYDIFVVLGMAGLILLFQSVFSTALSSVTYYSSCIIGFSLSYYNYCLHEKK